MIARSQLVVESRGSEPMSERVYTKYRLRFDCEHREREWRHVTHMVYERESQEACEIKATFPIIPKIARNNRWQKETEKEGK